MNSPSATSATPSRRPSKTWKAYEQGMGTPCNTKNNNDSYYEPDDAPFINYTDISGNASRCAAHLFDTTQLTTDLKSAATTPNFSWIAADDYYDGEASGNGSATSLKTQDGWLKQTLAPVLASPAWTQDRSLLILTWDESQNEGYDHVATTLVGSQGTVPARHQQPRPLRPLRHRPHHRGRSRPARPDGQRHLRHPAQRRVRPVHRDHADAHRRSERGHVRRQRHLPLRGAVVGPGERQELDRRLPGGRDPGHAVVAHLGLRPERQWRPDLLHRLVRRRRDVRRVLPRRRRLHGPRRTVHRDRRLTRPRRTGRAPLPGPSGARCAPSDHRPGGGHAGRLGVAAVRRDRTGGRTGPPGPGSPGPAGSGCG
ncbi:alkaline phosphatase family protein [Streptomyces lasalocidi]